MADHSNASSMISIAEEKDLPASYRLNHALELPFKDFETFLEHDLSVDELDKDIKHLWMVGRPFFPRPISIQRVLNRTIVPTNDAKLHLVWTTGKIFIKALPRYMLAESFKKIYFQPPPKPRDSPAHDSTPTAMPHVPEQRGELKRSALGLLYTYIALVPTELDFALAQENHLLPKEYQWSEWKKLVQQTIHDHPSNTIHKRISKRYFYGELRLSRLDKIHTYLLGSWRYGYSPLTSTQRYVEFFSRNVGLITASLAWVVIILTAMQVALMTDMLKDNSGFQWICSALSIAAMIVPFSAIVITLCRFVVIFLGHLIKTKSVHKARVKETGARIAKRREREAEAEL